MDSEPTVMQRIAGRLRSWDGLLLLILAAVIVLNTVFAPNYLFGDLGSQNQVNLWWIGIEKAIVVLAMAFVIINGEIDLSVASVMGLSAVVVAVLWEQGVAIEIAILVALLVGLGIGLFNGFWVAVVGLPSLVVTLAGLMGFRGLAYILIEDRSIGNGDTAFPTWFEDLGQQPLSEMIGVLDSIPFLDRVPFALYLYFGLLLLAAVVLGSSGFGRRTYVIGSSKDVAQYSGVGVTRHKMAIFVISAVTASLAGALLASHLGAVRGSTAFGWELDIITIVLLGGVSIFGGSGTMLGVFLSTMLVLSIRNGLGLSNVPGHTQTGVVGMLLILSVLGPNMIESYQGWARRRSLARAARASRDGPAP
ncbi:MAG: ABC transporter permease [Chloroflexota bacterium]|nr:ABC transporter permease [Chloroflexota bacterium]